MQTVSQAAEIVRFITAVPAGRVNQMVRALLDFGLLPKSSGRDIKKISAKELLPIVAAVAMADKVADAPNVARAFSDLPLEGKGGTHRTLGNAFAAIMENPEAWPRAEIEFAKQQSGYAATIRGVLRNGESHDEEVMLPFWRNPSWGHFCKTSFTISAEGIENMRNLFAREDLDDMRWSIAEEE